jgi:hypothetical protein
MTIRLLFALIARTIISSQSLCLAAAQNAIFVEIGMAENIVINNVNLTQVADASLSCASNNEIDVESMQDSIAKMLKTFLDNTSIPADVERQNSIETISKGFTAENVGACIAIAKNDYTFMIKKVGGTFNWQNFTLEQYATAQLEDCTMEFIIGEKTMKQYVQEDLLRLKEPICLDADAETNTHNVIGGVLGSIIVILVIATLAVGLSPTKQKQ